MKATILAWRPILHRAGAVFLGLVVGAFLNDGALGQGCPAPMFADAVALTAESAPSTYAVAVGDFNGDGKPDLAVANFGSFLNNYSDGDVLVLLGNGDGSFKVGAEYLSGNQPNSVAVGDFNGDGKPDLAVGNLSLYPGGCSSAGVSILLGNGDGSFQNGVNYSVAASSRGVAIGDFNRDGKPDLAVAMDCSQTNLAVLLGNGDGTFQTAVSYASGAPSAAVVVGDFNGDGNPDLVSANAGVLTRGTMSVWIGNGDGTFRAGTNYSAGINAKSVVAGDFNGDGKLDVAVADQGSPANGNTDGGVSVLLGNGDDTFQSAVSYGVVGVAARALAAADFNGDGKTDLAVVNSSDATLSDSAVSVFLGNGDGTFQPAASFYVGQSRPISLATGDFNGDRSTDLAVAVTESQPSSYLRGYVSVMLNACVSTNPLVSIAHGTGTVTISWPTMAIGFQLESATNLAASNSWSTVTDPIVVVGDQNTVTVTIDSARRFFRLRSHQ